MPPREWSSTSIRACLASEFTGEWGGNPTNGYTALVVRSTNLDDDGHVDLRGGAQRAIPRSKVTQKRLQTGDVLLEASGGGPGKPVGRVALFVDDGEGPYLCSNFFRALRPCSGLDSRFLAWRLLHLYRQPSIWVYQQQTTGIINLKHNDYLLQQFDLPPLPEQRRIAAILDTLDEAIRRTEQVIEKLKQMKQGLLHDLLTRGIDDNGELRPPPDEAPHLYKDSPLGWIPRGWEVDRLSSRFAVKGGKRLPLGHDYSTSPTGYRYLRVLDFYEKPVVFSTLEHLRATTFSVLRRYEIVEPNLFISIAGSLGHVGVFRQPPQVTDRTILTENAARLVAVAEASPDFAAAQINHHRVQQQIEVEKGTGGGVPKLALFRIESLRLVWPDLHEQKRIGDLIGDGESRLREEATVLSKLRTLKHGLMNDLLTGRVRVLPEAS